MKQKNNDFDFISSKFKEDNITAPESLSEEKIIEKIEGEKNPKTIKFKKKGVLHSVLTVAAALIIFVSGFASGSTAMHLINSKNEKSESSASSDIEGLEYFSSYDELEKRIAKAVDDKNNNSSEELKSADGTAAISSNTAAVQTHSKTNTQVEGVDEADIIKSDSKYIYYIPGTDYGENRKIEIFSAKGKNTKLLSKINAKADEFFDEMYLNGDTLIAVGYRFTNDKSDTFVNIYDISNREEPKIKSSYVQAGAYLSSRSVNNSVYIISNYYINNIKDGIVPYIEENDKKQELQIPDICAVKGSPDTSYAVIGAVNLDGKSNKESTKAVLGASSNVYCNDKNLYLTGSYNYDNNSSPKDTTVLKYSFDGLKITLKASNKIKGIVNDQFSLDEKDGNLRIATSVYSSEDSDKGENYLFILNENLNKIGEVSGFAHGEHIEAVRYINNTAYVITYEETDPLFVIDLSDPREPEIKGEVKIDGFSTSLTPVDENTVLGIGYSTVKNGDSLQQNGLKTVLFDISESENPKVLSQRSFLNADSPAQEDHKAICIGDKGCFAVPVSNYINEKSDNRIEIIKVKNRKLDISEIKCSGDLPINRCAYIGNVLYVPSENSEKLEAFELK